MSARMEIARAAWGDVPLWSEALVEACDASSQGQVAKQIGYSAGLISAVLRKTYKADTAAIEARVIAILRPNDVSCPALKVITSADCLKWQDQAGHLISRDPMAVMMFKACRRCPVYLGEAEHDA